MSIAVSCQCGAKFSAKDELAGRTVKCPKCSQPLKIAAAADIDDAMGALLEEAGVRAGVPRCPGCGAEMLEEAVLCVMCGFDMRKGHRLKTRSGSLAELEDAELGDLPTHGNPHLDHAERQIARDKIQQKNLSKGVPWWIVFLAFAGLIGFVAAMVSIPQDRAMETSGLVLQGAGIVLASFYLLRIAYTAFREAPMQGLLVLLLLPIFGVYYIATRWDRVGPFFIFALGGAAVFGMGVLLVTIAPMLKPKASDEATTYLNRARPAVVRLVDSDRAARHYQLG